MLKEKMFPENANRQSLLIKRFTQALISIIGSSAGFLFAIVFIALANGATAAPQDGKSQFLLDFSALSQEFNSSLDKSEKRGWAWTFDNDILVPSTRDQDYTYGLSFSKQGSSPSFLNSPLSLMNTWLRLENRFGLEKSTVNSFEIGAYGFTPEIKENTQPQNNDRPYASILYVSASQNHRTANPDVFWRTSLSLGVLGLDIVGDLQNEVHNITGSEEVKGWDSQISDGGEATARYSISRHRRWDTKQPSLELKTSSALTLGYITEASYGVNARFGRVQSSWRSQSHELAMYGEHTRQPPTKSGQQECYWLFGSAIKLRAYNAFLQGQFRHSDVHYSSSELNHAIVEAWAGYSHAFSNGYRLTYILRGHSSEVKSGVANRNVVWGGLTLSRLI